MKIKKSLLSLFALPVLLVSCGQGNSIAGLPSGGHNMAQAQGKEEMNNAIQATVNATTDDAIGAKIQNANLVFDYQSTFTDRNSTILGNTGASLDVTNFNFLGGAEGLFSRNPDDVALYTTTSATAKANLTSQRTDYGKQIDFKMPELVKNFQGDYAFGANIQNRNMYFDLSNDSLYYTISDIANTVAKIVDPTSNFDFAISFPDRKVYAPTDWDLDDFPLLEEETFTQKLFDEFDSLPEVGEYKDHGNGTYSYSGSFHYRDLDDVFEEFFDNDIIDNDLFENDKIFDNDAFDDNILDTDIFEDAFDDIVYDSTSTLTFVALFGSKGIQSLTFDGKVSGKAKHRLESREPFYKTTETKADFNFKVDFFYGKDVEFPTLNTSEYVPMPVIR